MEVLLTAQELAALLKISMRQVWRLRDSGTIPLSMAIGDGGRKLRWSGDTITRWVNDGMPNVRRTGWMARDERDKK